MYFIVIEDNTLVYCLCGHYLIYCFCGQYLRLLSLQTLLRLLSLRTTNFVNMTNSKFTPVIQKYVVFHSQKTHLPFLFNKIIFMTAHPLGVLLVFQWWFSTRLQYLILDLLRPRSASWLKLQSWLWTSKFELTVALSIRPSTKLVGPSNSVSPTRLGQHVCF